MKSLAEQIDELGQTLKTPTELAHEKLYALEQQIIHQHASLRDRINAIAVQARRENADTYAALVDLADEFGIKPSVPEPMPRVLRSKEVADGIVSQVYHA